MLAVAIIGVVLAATSALLPFCLALSARQAVIAAADAAALAAADVAAGIVAGVPCDAANMVAVANGATLASCAVDGLVVTVSAKRSFLGLELRAAATAGPPEAKLN